MSRRLNLFGFSLAQMRRLFASRDEQAARQICDRMETERPYWSAEERRRVSDIVEQAIMSGVPFAHLQAETNWHALAADAMARHDQEWLITDASAYHAEALEEGLWKQYGRYAGPEIKAFLRGLVEGVPFFGRQPPPDEPYAAIRLEKLQHLQAGLEDFREQVTYRLGRKRHLTEEDRAAAEFVAEFCGWVEQIREAGRDLWFVSG